MNNSRDFLAVKGLPVTGSECFRGIDASLAVSGAIGGVPGQAQPPPNTALSTSTTFAAALWTAQTALITRQSGYLKHVKRECATRWDDLPAKLKDRTIKESMIEEFLAWLAGKIVGYFQGPAAEEIAQECVSLVAMAIRFVQLLYTAGEALCDAMIQENTALQSLEQSRENYDLRSKILTQHDLALHNLVTEISEVERVIDNSDVTEQLKRMNETMELTQSEEHIVQCPYTCAEISTKSFTKDSAP